MEIYNDTYCVYAHINKSNNKIYVGQTKFGDDPNKRWRDGKGYQGCACFYQAIQKYGWDGFEHELIASNLTQKEANSFEELLISLLRTRESACGYNIQPGGDNHEWSDVSKLKMAKSLKATVRDKHREQADIELADRFANGDNRVRRCIKCGVLFETLSQRDNVSFMKSMKRRYSNGRPQMCMDCQRDARQKPKNVVKICVDCGKEFVCQALATRTTRCEDCRKDHAKHMRSGQNERYYQ